MRKDFTITRDQIIELALRSDKASIWLQQHFKDAFKTVLKSGNWYRSTVFPKWNLYITEIDNNLKKVKGFGFGADGSWMENALKDSWDFYELEKCFKLSTEEAENLLKKEAIKRGYSKGVWLKKSGVNVRMHQELKISGEFDYYPESNILDDSHGNGHIFDKGIWAEIIPTKTKQEAEKELNCKIID